MSGEINNKYSKQRTKVIDIYCLELEKLEIEKDNEVYNQTDVSEREYASKKYETSVSLLSKKLLQDLKKIARLLN